MFLVPVERDNPTRHTSWVVYALLVANLAAAVATLVAGSSKVFEAYGFVPTDPTWPDLVTSMFLHGNLWHIVGNLIFLWSFGDNVEDVLGAVPFLALFLLSGAVACGAHLAMNPTSELPLIGASGGISGVLGAYVVFFPRVPTDLSLVVLRWEVRSFKVTALVAAWAWFAQQVVFGWVLRLTGLDEVVPIAFWAHVGGVVAGVALAAAFLAAGCMRSYAEDGCPRTTLFGYVGRHAPRPM